MDRIVSDCSTEYAWVVSGVRHPSGKSVSITISLRVVLSTFICVCVCVHRGHGTHRRQKVAFRSRFFLSTLWVLRTKTSSSGLK